MRRAMLVVGFLALSLGVSVSAMAMSGMTMPTSQPQAKMDMKQIDALFQTALGGLRFTEGQAMKAHDILMNMVDPMEKLAMQIDAASGAAKDLKNQEMMLLMQKAQVELEGALDENQMHVLNGLVFGEFPAAGHASDKAQAARLKAAADLRAAMDDHEIIVHAADVLAMTMPGMSNMPMIH